MKQTVKHIIYMLTIALFLTYSSGLIITVHHCCHKHHHASGDHRHCTENTYIFKITDQYDNDQNVKKSLPVPEIFHDFTAINNLLVIQHADEPCLEHCHCLFHTVHRCLFHVISQLIL